MSAYPKKLIAPCIGVLSGDRILFQGPPDQENGGFKQKILHLTGITAPKVDSANGNDEKFGYAARQFLRKRLVGKTLPFVIEKKAGEIELGYVLLDEKDVSIDLLSNGLAKLRGDKINCDHFDEYHNAQVDAEMAERGLWSLDNKPKGADRYVKRAWTDKELFDSVKGKSIRAVVEEIHPSKAVLYSQQLGWMGVLNFSEVQVVVLSEVLKNGQKQSNVRAIRSTLDSIFLNREVDVTFTSVGQSLQGYITVADEDVRKVLLRNGYAKLGKDSISGITTKEFMELKMIAQQALQQGKGLWKDQKEKVPKGELLNSKSYSAVVCQVNSGDSLTVCNDKNEFHRIYLPNIRSPVQNQPFAYQAKEGLRRRIIGCRVRVQVQFSRKINVKKFEGDVGELKDFIFASIFQNNINVSTYLLQQGLVSLQTPKVEEDMTKYFQSLREAEAKGKKDRKGQYGNGEAKAPNFNDLSGGKGKKVDAAKCKNIFPFIKDQKNLTGVIDLVLNGSRFKVRFNQQHVMVIMVLQGVRCLPNQGPFAKASELALQYSKLHINQRDAQIQLKSVDLKGIFHGKIYVNKKDYAIQLLEKGLAVCMGGKFHNPRYADAQALARKNKLGLWQYNLNLSSLKGQIEKEFKPVNFNKTLTLTELSSAEEFYLQPQGAKRPDVPQNPKPVTNVQIGGLYSCKFSVDGVYYRARVLKQVGKNKYEVVYIDFGNSESAYKENLGQLSEQLKGIKSPLFKCGLFGVQALSADGLTFLKDFVGVSLKVQFKEQSVPQGKEDVQYRVILTEKDSSVNLQLLQYGQAECSCDLPEWRKAEQKAKQLREGKWANDQI